MTKPPPKPPGAKRVRSTGSPGGRPSFEPTPEQRQWCAFHAANGLTHNQIARIFSISRNTLEKHFQRELEEGFDRVLGKVAGNLAVAALRGERWAVCFWLKTRAKWSETHRVVTAGANGDGETVHQIPVVILPDNGREEI